MPKSIQLNARGELNHLLTIEGLPKAVMLQVLDHALEFVDLQRMEVRNANLLEGKTIFNIFFENSTRTRTTFEIAATKLAARVVNFDVNRSSTVKGESLLDTIDNLAAMKADMFVLRHGQSGAPYLIARHVNQVAPHIHIMNAGDGRHAHPTQALLDVLTIRHFKGAFQDLRVAIVGDVLHSRVARSDIHALTTLGVPDIRVIAPLTLMPAGLREMGVQPYTDLKQGLEDVDVVIALRLQSERMRGAMLPSPQEYFKHYGLTEERLSVAKPDAIVMHPGPMNRGVEIDSLVADGARSVILQQVTFGIAVRMAVMSLLNRTLP